MDKPSAYGQWTLGLVVFLTVLAIANLYVIGSRAIQMTINDAAAPFVALVIGVGFLSLSLLWWGNNYGNLMAIGVGVLSLVNLILGLIEMSAGNIPNAVLIPIIPAFIASLGLIFAAFMAWRE